MSNTPLICGIDEAGRGPLAGPVYAACVHIPENVLHLPFWQHVTDSKKVTLKKRKELEALILQHAICGVDFCTVEEIDNLNILQASLLAMTKAFHKMSAIHQGNWNALIDGNKIPKQMPCPAQAIIKGDSKHLEIAAASILAKVGRDRIMHDLHTKHPEYGWNTNSGYGSKTHMEAIEQHGVTIHHRRSFSPVRAALAA
jgi:ribonuclease HII